MHVESHHTAELIRAEPRAKVARRLAAVRLALLGRTAAQVAAEVLLSERVLTGRGFESVSVPEPNASRTQKVAPAVNGRVEMCCRKKRQPAG